MKDKIKIINSLGETIREDGYSEYIRVIRESIFILNVAKLIEPQYISKELGIKIRNLNDQELNNCYIKVKDQLIKSMSNGYEKLYECSKYYDATLSEMEAIRFIHNQTKIKELGFYQTFLNYIYAQSIYSHNHLGINIDFVKEKDFENIEFTSDKLARDICSKIIVLEIEDYQKIYKIMKKYYHLDEDIEKHNMVTNDFIKNFVRLCNILFLEIDSNNDEKDYKFKINPYESFSFEICEIVEFFDGYVNNYFLDNTITNRLDKINSDYIDKFIHCNKENLNNLLFIVSRLSIGKNENYEFDYREYNLSLISILELLLVSSKNALDVKSKFIKNILICLSINDDEIDIDKEQKILKEIYSYRSCILHGNYSGYTNAMSNLEKCLMYEPEDYEISKYNTIDYLISRKLNHYVSSIFEILSKNKIMIDVLKSDYNK